MYTEKPVVRFDPAKSERNRECRGFGFELAKEFEWDSAIVSEDRRRDYGEERLQAIGLIGERLHVMVFTRRFDALHVISLRKANRRERSRYEAQTKTNQAIAGKSGVDP